VHASELDSAHGSDLADVRSCRCGHARLWESLGSALLGRYRDDPLALRYMEVGHDMVAKIDVTSVSGQSPAGDIEGPAADLVADKTAFGSERSRRWFGPTWPAAWPDPPLD
jgi:hypothetical protein